MLFYYIIACAKTKSIPSYRYSIKQRATTVTNSFATKVVIYQKVPRSLYLFDFGTHYTGYYTSGTSAVVTGFVGGGTPFVMFGGFKTIYNNLPIKVEGPYGTVTSYLTTICTTNVDSPIYNFNGDYLGICTIGVKYTTRHLPYGINTFKITVDDDVLIYTIIRQ